MNWLLAILFMVVAVAFGVGAALWQARRSCGGNGGCGGCGGDGGCGGGNHRH